jgi:hypothetical protein
MTLPRTRPPFVADERTQLLGWLDLQRALVRRKSEGLSDEQSRASLIPTSPLMTVAGLVSHMRWTEHCWFEVLFLGHDSSTNPQFTEVADDLDWLADGVPLAKLLDEYEAQCALSNEIVAGSGLDAVGCHPDFGASAGTLLHMREETGRHVGHLDLLQELLDGETGYY